MTASKSSHITRSNIKTLKEKTFREYGLAVVDEILTPEKGTTATISEVKPWEEPGQCSACHSASLIPYMSGLSTAADGQDDDLQITQDDYNEAAGLTSTDRVYEKFMNRIRRGKL